MSEAGHDSTTPPHADHAILMAWTQFREAVVALERCDDMSGPEESNWEARFGSAQDILADTPARTAEGLAIQLRYLFWTYTEGHDQDRLFAGKLPRLGSSCQDVSFRVGRNLIATVERGIAL